MRHEELESPENSPYTRIRVGVIEAVYYDDSSDPQTTELNPSLATPSSSTTPITKVLGRAKIAWADTIGGRDLIQFTFPQFSNEVQSNIETGEKVAFAFGDISLPSIGSIAVIGFRDKLSAVILGYLPINYSNQTSDNPAKDSTFGTFRRVIPGEFSRLSRQQAEIYQDQMGAVQIIVQAQPSLDEPGVLDGSAVQSFDDLDITTLPESQPSEDNPDVDVPLATVTVGETYTDDSFTTRAVSSKAVPVILQVNCASGVKLSIDSDGNVDLQTAPDMTFNLVTGTTTMTSTADTTMTASNVNINNGSQGAARLNDMTLSNISTDSGFWTFIQTLFTTFNAHVHTSTAPGNPTSPPVTPLLTQPSQLQSKISSASGSVVIGN